MLARGRQPLPALNLDPDIERQIERVLILADKPVLTRPIAAATVLDALPAACQKDAVLCREVRRYLAPLHARLERDGGQRRGRGDQRGRQRRAESLRHDERTPAGPHPHAATGSRATTRC